MPARCDESPSPSLSPLNASSGRRLLSRMRSPFASKVRNITDFHIDVNDPHRQYQPGDLVTGSVRLRVNKPVRVTHLVVCLHGFVQVYKNPGSPGEGYRANAQYLANGRQRKSSGEYFGNGFASLFEDEVVLCGDGRLAEGTYQFNFELEFPDRDLPSSIDFERGTISYMITATLTRPTPIAPTMTCDRKVYLVEKIDISPLSTPRSRTITLEPISKRHRAKTQARKYVDPGRKTDSLPQSDELRRSPLPPVSITASRDLPRSPSPSEISFDSLRSSNGHPQHSDNLRPSVGTGTSEHSKSSVGNSKTIVSTIEMQNGGCLRGDSVAFKIHVNHSKPIKSVHGVIVTLYRQGRVDMHPAIPLGPTEKGKAAKYEDYYPKSYTGLGGLSLSGAGSSHVFRKDLAQTLAPLYVDPHTLVADITTKVQIPEGAFPSISTVPGSMISFKYYVEVILDIQGKLATQDRNIGNLGGLTSTQVHMGSFLGMDLEANPTMPFGSPILDTAQIRRDKGVVFCTFEVIVGTQDSERRKGKRKVEITPEVPVTNGVHANNTENTEQSSFRGEQEYSEWYDEPEAHHEHYWPAPYPSQYYSRGANGYDYTNGWHDEGYEYHQQPLPIPEIPEESQLSEKERLRRMEERLLPSQPPDGYGPSSANGHSMEASAPYLEDEVPQMSAEHMPSAPAYEASSSAAMATTNGAGSSTQPYHAPPPLPSPTSLFVPGQSPSFTHANESNPRNERNDHEATVPSLGDVEPSEQHHEIISNGEPPTASPSNDVATCPVPASYDSHADASGTVGLPRYEEHRDDRPG